MGTSSRSFLKAIEMWKEETIKNKELGIQQEAVDTSHKEACLDAGYQLLLDTQEKSAVLPEHPTRQQKNDVKELMAIVSRLYPCRECADHFKDVLSPDDDYYEEDHGATDLLNLEYTSATMAFELKYIIDKEIGRQVELKMASMSIMYSHVNSALRCLPKYKHKKFISQTGILEFKCGVPDRGRTMFEHMLKEFPNKTDLWSVYLDQEIRLGDADKIRALFERAISLSLHPKRMKCLFKKYLEYEKTHGDEERVEYVKRRAIEYVDDGTFAP